MITPLEENTVDQGNTVSLTSLNYMVTKVGNWIKIIEH